MRFVETLIRWWCGARVPEREPMEDAAEVEAYASAAAQRHLSRLDERAAGRVSDLAPEASTLLDIGCGPANILLLVAERRPGLLAIGVDLSRAMLRQAAAQARGLPVRVLFVRASATQLPFRSGSFDLVLSNSLLHHLGDPARGIEEAGRVAGRKGAIFMRDLRRPPRPWLRGHLAVFGRHYEGKMRDLFNASVRAAYTRTELGRMFAAIPGMRVARRGGAHLEAARPMAR